MTATKVSAREFWLYDNGEIPFLAFYTEEELSEKTNNRQIDKYHVIERSAYDCLKEHAERLAEALDGVYKRHLWQPGMGECICDHHTLAATRLAEYRKEFLK